MHVFVGLEQRKSRFLLASYVTSIHWPHSLWCGTNSVNECHYLSENTLRLQLPLLAVLWHPALQPPGHGPGPSARVWAELEQSVGQSVPWGLNLNRPCSRLIADWSPSSLTGDLCVNICLNYTQAPRTGSFIAFFNNKRCKPALRAWLMCLKNSYYPHKLSQM